MKNFILDIFSFSAIILLIILVVNNFQKHYNNEPPHYELHYIEANNPKSHYNKVIIGNSTAVHSTRPSLLDNPDTKVYNFALNGSSVNFYKDWLDNLFSVKQPKVDSWIIYTDYNFLSGSGWRKFEQDSEFFSYQILWKALCSDNKLNKKSLISNRLPFMKYKNRILKSFDENQGSFEFEVDDYDKGYITQWRNDKVDLSESYRERTLTSDAKTNFIAFIDKLSSIGGELIFVIPPEYHLKKKHYKSVKEFLMSICLEREISLYDFNDDHYKKSLHKVGNFVDRMHLSKTGSKVYSKLLGEILKNERVQKK